jgi:hypothetical protein
MVQGLAIPVWHDFACATGLHEHNLRVKRDCTIILWAKCSLRQPVAQELLPVVMTLNFRLTGPLHPSTGRAPSTFDHRL